MPHENKPVSESPRKALVIRTLILGAFALGLIRLAGLVEAAAANVLYADQWDFLAPLFSDSGALASVLHQHGPHRQGLGGLFQWLLYPATAWDVRAEAWLAVLVLALAAALATALAIRLRGRPHASDALIPLVVLSPLHWETILLTPNIAHSILPFGMLLGLACLLGESTSRPRSVIIGLIGSACVFTGFGFCASLALALVLITGLSPAYGKEDRQNHLLALGLLSTGFILFFLNYRWDPAIPGWVFPVDDWWNYGTFSAYMMASLVGLRETTALAAGMGFLLLSSVLAVLAINLRLLWRGENIARASAITLLTASSLMYSALAAYGRLPVNIEAAFMWRYMTLMLPALLGCILHLQSWQRPAAKRAIRYGASACIVMISLPLFLTTTPEANALAIGKAKQRWIAAYLETTHADRANQLSEFWIYPQPQNPPHIIERLHWLEARGLTFFTHSTPGQGEPDK